MQKNSLKPALRIILGLLSMLAAAPTRAQDQDDAGSDPQFVLSRAGDAGKGERVFGRCRSCHLLKGNKPRPGPSLQNIFGRPAGTAPGYKSYSKALRESGIVWDERSLDAWISNPLDFLPGNKMSLAPIRTAQERMDLIAYLREATE